MEYFVEFSRSWDWYCIGYRPWRYFLNPPWLTPLEIGQGGFSMASCIPDSPGCGSGSFRKIVDAFLSREGLPFADILSAEQIRRIFAKHNGLFGLHGVYTTAIVVWSFLGQVLRDGKEASCQAAVARVVSYCEQIGVTSPTEDTGDYCRARSKLSAPALHELSCEVAEELEQASDPSWLWKDKHAMLIDGFTFTMPDTLKNQAQYPQQKAQKPGVGLPIARAVAMVSLATACVMDLAIGPFKGKETGESALLRSMLKRLVVGDIAVMDRYYCSFMMIALLLQQGVQTCARKHHLRRVSGVPGKAWLVFSTERS
jgi:putative transposase